MINHVELLFSTIENNCIMKKNIINYKNDVCFRNEKELRQLQIYPKISNESIDFSGQRVSSHMIFIKYIQLLELIRITTSSIFSKSLKEMKYVKYTPNSWKTDYMCKLYKYMNSMKSFLLNGNVTKKFQYKNAAGNN